MQRAFSYALVATTSVLLTGCPEDPPDFTNFNTESATEGLTEGPDDTTGDPPGTTTSGGSTSTGSDETSSDGGGSSSESTGDPPGGICGDGIISGQEECDCAGGPCTPEGLGNKGCVDAEPDPLIHLGPLTGGVLGCNPASCKFEVDLCTWCGDGEVNGGENCEPDLAITETCMTLGEGSAGDLSCGEACQIDTSGCTECGAQFDFNDCLDPAWFLQLTHGNGTNPPSWECGVLNVSIEDGPPGKGETVWATNLEGDYLADESAAIISPVIDLQNCADGEEIELRVTHWYDFEGGVTNRDGGIVQVSSDGFNWSTRTPTGGSLYVDQNVLATTYNPPDGQFGFSGNSGDAGMWVESAFDVSDFAGTNELQVRFVFGTDNGTNRAGWYIDKVELVGSGGA